MSFADRLRALREKPEEGSLVFAMLITVIVMALGAFALPEVVNLARNAGSDANRVSAVGAAQSGLQNGLGRIRSARDSSGAGSSGALPCGSPLTGFVTGNSGASYSVTMAYYDADPRTTASQTPITCSSLATHAPSYVTLTSVGTVTTSGQGSKSRTLTSTYVVATNNQNIPGGNIQNKNDGAATYKNLCFDAGSATPAAGQFLTVTPCQANVPDNQRFSYRRNLTIALNSSVTSSSSGMCLQADPSKSLANDPTMMFEPCKANTDSDLYLQQWSFNDGAQFQSTTSAKALGSYCFKMADLDPSSTPNNVILDTCNTTGPVRQGSWVPSPAAGAGMAGAGTNQLVNFKQFGRCLDLANFDVNQPAIAYPCKQTPTGVPGWNQRWVYNSAKKTIVMVANLKSSTALPNPNQPYCLVVPASDATGNALRTKVLPCPDPTQATPAQFVWNNHLGTGESNAVKYSYTDANNRCLTASDSDFFLTSDTPGNNISWVTVTPCDGSLLQKWNADPTVLLANPLRDVNEPYTGN